MPIDEPSNETEMVQRQLQRMVRHFSRLSARIAFLAKQLDLPLQTPAQTQAALECDDLCNAPASNPREARLREELRALLVMRYELVARLAANERVGATAMRDILLSANDRLLAKGFDPQDPGMNLQPLFDSVEMHK